MVARKNYIPDRADIIWVDFSPTKGHEQSGLRPSVVVSNKQYNSISGLVVICPMTKKNKGYFFEVKVFGPDGESYVLVDQVRSIDLKERINKKDGRVSMEEIYEIMAKLDVLFQ